MSRITITLNDHERKALHQLAEREFRDVHGQAAFIIRKELERLGLLKIAIDQKIESEKDGDSIFSN